MRNHRLVTSLLDPRRSILARTDPDGSQVVDITVDHGYRPRSIVARAGAPLRLVFHRRDDEVCSERVVFSSPRIDRRLASGADTTIVLPPQAPGVVRFTCAMGRYRGQIELTGEARPRLAISSRLRALGVPPGEPDGHRPRAVAALAAADRVGRRARAGSDSNGVAGCSRSSHGFAGCRWSFGESRGRA